MKITGQHAFGAPADEVYRRLLDPARLRQCMPGVERLEAVSDDRLAVTLVPPVPAIKGQFSGTVDIFDQQPPTGFRMKIDATGQGGGFVQATAEMRIEADGADRSTVHYDADARVGGPAAAVGQRVLAGISRRQVEQMMRCLDRERPGALVRFLEWLRSRFGRRRKSTDPAAPEVG
jgi:carbon monoxide dehydrogenase subunit G